VALAIDGTDMQSLPESRNGELSVRFPAYQDST